MNAVSLVPVGTETGGGGGGQDQDLDLDLEDSPLVSSCPKTDGVWLVEQFQRSCLNWFWHSETARRAPSWTLGSRKDVLWHRLLWRGLRGT